MAKKSEGSYSSCELNEEIYFSNFKSAKIWILFLFYVLSFFKKGDTIQRGTLFKEIRYFLRKKILHVCLIRDYCLLQKIPCTFIYFWTFIPCCMLIRDSWLFRTLEYPSKLYIPNTLNTDYLLWHTQLIVCAVKY